MRRHHKKYWIHIFFFYHYMRLGILIHIFMNYVWYRFEWCVTKLCNIFPIQTVAKKYSDIIGRIRDEESYRAERQHIINIFSYIFLQQKLIVCSCNCYKICIDWTIVVCNATDITQLNILRIRAPLWSFTHFYF